MTDQPINVRSLLPPVIAGREVELARGQIDASRPQVAELAVNGVLQRNPDGWDVLQELVLAMDDPCLHGLAIVGSHPGQHDPELEDRSCRHATTKPVEGEISHRPKARRAGTSGRCRNQCGWREAPSDGAGENSAARSIMGT